MPKPARSHPFSRGLANFTERTRMAAVADLLQPWWRMVWLNFLSGLGRGFGQFLGLAVVGSLLLLALAAFLAHAKPSVASHPWLESIVNAILEAIDRYNEAKE